MDAAGTDAWAPAAPEAGRGTGTARALLRACRPKQWLKNLLVFAAPGAAGVLGEPAALAWSLVAFAAFCLAASGTYLLNDVLDAEADRAHERKRHRPVASGAVPVPLALAAGAAALTASLAAAAAAAVVTGRFALLAVLVGYLVLTTAYTLVLKRVTIADIVAVAGCHVLRALAGGVAVGVPFTSWFLIVVSLAALLVVVGKREAELRNPHAGDGRTALRGYSRSYLVQIRTMASAAMIVTYCLWALEGQGEGGVPPFHAASIVPFIVFVLRYHLLVDRGVGEEPEEIALRDRPLQLCLLGLAALVGLGVYAG
ncbi:decaprenyl-phosphate phosphoribosyltransferase [Nocardiopsis halophila]|uniref:decaprenyl-phosphate phosphoribosyltransferase n=1 Tax=Nocardiopsis halophila TaxID=141692 RepID=UPI000349FF5E|nr:decaprenyl-phosphate phosphoribosyltransferase [Nocardiopsis halophila]